MLRRLVVLAVLLAACGGGGGSPIADARRIVEDDHRFETSYDAGDALAKVSATLLAAGKQCDKDCAALLSAAAYAQVLAVHVLDCTAPGRFKVRAAMRSELEKIEHVPKGAPAPVPPRPPRCG